MHSSIIPLFHVHYYPQFLGSPCTLSLGFPALCLSSRDDRIPVSTKCATARLIHHWQSLASAVINGTPVPLPAAVLITLLRLGPGGSTSLQTLSMGLTTSGFSVGPPKIQRAPSVSSLTDAVESNPMGKEICFLSSSQTL